MNSKRSFFQFVAQPGSRRGVTVVEFALTLPILLVMVVGMIEFVRLHNLRHAADNAAYEAARNVIVPGASAGDATSQGHDLLARAGVGGATIVITPSVISESTDQVNVMVSVPLSSNSWLPPYLTNDRNVVRDCTLMTERVPMIQARAVPTSPPPPPPGDDSDDDDGGSSTGGGDDDGSSDDGSSDDGSSDDGTGDDGSGDDGSGDDGSGDDGSDDGGGSSEPPSPPPPAI